MLAIRAHGVQVVVSINVPVEERFLPETAAPVRADLHPQISMERRERLSKRAGTSTPHHTTFIYDVMMIT